MNSTAFNQGELMAAVKAAQVASDGLVYGGWGNWAEGNGIDDGARYFSVDVTLAESPVAADDETVEMTIVCFVSPFPDAEAIADESWEAFDAETEVVTDSFELRGAIGNAVTHREMTNETAAKVEKAIDAFLDALGIEHERIAR